MSFLLGVSSYLSLTKPNSFPKVFIYSSNLSIYYSFAGLKIFFIYSTSVFKLLIKKAVLSLPGGITGNLRASLTSVGPPKLCLSYYLSLKSINSTKV